MTFSLSQYSRTPKNARSKRAMDARQPKEIEDPRTAIFVKGTHTGEVLNGAMKELVRRIYPFSQSHYLIHGY
jgi:ribosome production factor 2